METLSCVCNTCQKTSACGRRHIWILFTEGREFVEDFYPFPLVESACFCQELLEWDVECGPRGLTSITTHVPSYRTVCVQVCLLLRSRSASQTTENVRNLGLELPSLILQKLDLLILPPHIQKRTSFLDFPETNTTSPLWGSRLDWGSIFRLWDRGGEERGSPGPGSPSPPGRLSASKRLSISGRALS